MQSMNYFAKQFQIIATAFLICLVSIGCETAPETGGWASIPVDGENVIAAAEFAVLEHATASGEKLTVAEIVAAEGQVVGIYNYNLTLTVKRDTQPIPQKAVAEVYEGMGDEDGPVMELTSWTWK